MSVCVIDWTFWRGETREDVAAAKGIELPRSVKRRLNHLGRSVGNVAAGLVLEDQQDALVVFASRYGDAERSVGILQEIAANEPISPMQFSLSVHNAIAGVLSIGWKNTEMQSVISAGAQTFEMGITEAYSLSLAFPQKGILLVYADFPLPEIFGNFEEAGAIPKVSVFMFKADTEHSGGVVFEVKPSENKEPIASTTDLLDLEALFDGKRDRAVIGLSALKWEFCRYVA